jgi:hypothetical protein
LSCEDVCKREIWEFTDDLLSSLAGGQTSKNELNGDTGMFEARRAVQDQGITFDSILPPH